jgi:myosin-crossreactive antigen
MGRQVLRFWYYMWSTTFAFQPWHSAVEFKRYLLRFMMEFTRIETLAGVKRTIYNQYDSLILPLQAWLTSRGVQLITDCKVSDLDHRSVDGEILHELCGHLRFDMEVVTSANCIPCTMPYITSMFMPRRLGDRPLPVPAGSRNFAFISQFVEIADDVVFTVEYSVRAAQMAVYELLGVSRKVPPVTRHDKSIRVKFEAFVKAFQ